MNVILNLILAGASSLAFSATAFAGIDIPQKMSAADRQTSLKVLGFGFSTKILSDPYPLGGYSGYEFGIAESDVPVGDLKTLGSGLSSGPSDVSYTNFSFGKGLYNNVDFFINITPYLQSTQVSQYGGLLRWTFYQAEYLPFSLSALFEGSYSNVANQITTRTVAVDLVGGLNVNQVGLFAGVGSISTTGNFMGRNQDGTRGITDSGFEETASVTGFHSLLGINVRFSEFFVSAQMDNYSQSIFSAKLGMRL